MKCSNGRSQIIQTTSFQRLVSEMSDGRQLAILGGTPALPQGLKYCPPFKKDIEELIHTQLFTKPLSTLFVDQEIGMFEEKFASILNSPYAVAFNSGTSALHAALLAVGISAQDEVAVNSFSFVASASVVFQVGAKPIYIDINRNTLSLDMNDLKKKITPRTKAVVVAHLFGMPADIDKISQFCKEQGLILIEDACQAMCATLGDKYVGTFGDVGCFSFNSKKVIKTGQGGMLVCKNEDVAQVARELKTNGRSRFGVERVGFNYAFTNLQASLGHYQLDYLDEIMAKRKKYSDKIRLSLSKYVDTFPEHRQNVKQSYYAVPFMAGCDRQEERDILIAALYQEGIPVGGVFNMLYHHTDAFGLYDGPLCPIAESIVLDLSSINADHVYADDDVELICDGIDKVFSQRDVLRDLI